MLAIFNASHISAETCLLADKNDSDAWNRKKVLVLGWLFGIPVPFILLFAPSWNWIPVANVLLGVNQGLAWSMTVNMKLDLVGKEKRGLALRLNEFEGYISVALISFLTGYIAAAYGLKPYPFYLIAFSLLGFLNSVLLVRDTSRFTELELRQARFMLILLSLFLELPLVPKL